MKQKKLLINDFVRKCRNLCVAKSDASLFAVVSVPGSKDSMMVRVEGHEFKIDMEVLHSQGCCAVFPNDF